MMNKVIETSNFVFANSVHVEIDEGKIDNFCLDFKRHEMRNWLENSPYDISALDDKDKLSFLFVLHSLSFCYWGNPKWTVEYKGKKLDGSWAMVASLGRAIENNTPLLNFEFLKNVGRGDLKKILKGSIEIPLFDERLEILREIGRVMSNKFDGNPENVLESANYDASGLLDLITKEFPSFNDCTIYSGKDVYFFKRAQLLISDIFDVFQKKKYSKIWNIEILSSPADYKIPQILRKFGILKYSKELESKIDNMIIIEKDSREEVEIRANTIQAVEIIKKKLNTKLKDIRSTDIAHYLWLLSQNKSQDDKPYHMTRTTYY